MAYPNSMTMKSSFCSTGPMLIAAAFCIALSVTLQEVGEHDLVALRFHTTEVLGRFGVHGCNKIRKNELVQKMSRRS